MIQAHHSIVYLTVIFVFESLWKDVLQLFTRVMIQRILGVFWLIDGLLQLKPKMFTSSFLSQVVEPTSKSEPTTIARLVNFGIHLAGLNIAFFDALFALVQILLGLGLMFNVRPRILLIASITWSVFVWIFGEGVGQMFTGQALMLTGAPGAVLLYGLIAVALWPRREIKPLCGNWRPFQIHFARISLGLIWMVGCILHFQHAYANGSDISSLISIPWIGHIVDTHAATTGLFLTVLEFGIGSMYLLNIYKRFAAWTSIVVSLIFWWIGQSFGQIFSPLATDVNSGPLLILLAFTAYPWLLRGPRELEEHNEDSEAGKSRTIKQSHMVIKNEMHID